MNFYCCPHCGKTTGTGGNCRCGFDVILSSAPRAHGKLIGKIEHNGLDWRDLPMILLLAIGFGIAGALLFS